MAGVGDWKRHGQAANAPEGGVNPSDSTPAPASLTDAPCRHSGCDMGWWLQAARVLAGAVMLLVADCGRAGGAAAGDGL